jgi:ATP-dependent helicase/nuclease subunit A
MNLDGKFINENDDHESLKEDFPLRKYGDVKGRIIHRILQKNISPSELQIEGDKIIDGELKDLNIASGDENKLRRSVNNDLSRYYNSEIYKYLNGFTEFNNEFNLYTAEKDYFLFGIIDKLILSEQQAIIVDYKTDDISEKEIAERSELYFNQLKFYSYIIKSAFKKVLEIKVILVFLKYPDKDISLVLSSDEIEQTGTNINRMVTQIRQKNYSKNFDHCRSCHFFINNNCIIK